MQIWTGFAQVWMPWMSHQQSCQFRNIPPSPPPPMAHIPTSQTIQSPLPPPPTTCTPRAHAHTCTSLSRLPSCTCPHACAHAHAHTCTSPSRLPSCTCPHARAHAHARAGRHAVSAEQGAGGGGRAVGAGRGACRRVRRGAQRRGPHAEGDGKPGGGCREGARVRNG
eukprot:293513-Chlamydomonas_euryale.AAC.2